MPKPVTPKRPRAKPSQGGSTSGVLIDDLAAERNSPPLPPEPVFTIDLVEAEAGKRGRRYVAELEEHASRNARAAAEARAIALEQRSHLEQAARGRLEAERKISKLQRDLRLARAEQERLATRRKTPRAAPPALAAPVVENARGGAAKSELTRTREMLEQQERLLGDRRDQLVHALRERDEARLEARRAADARDRAERSLSRATEILQHTALEETARIAATARSALDTVDEHEREAEENQAARLTLEARVLVLTQEVERLSGREVELEEALSLQKSRADAAVSRCDVLVADAEAAGGDVASARQELADALARESTALATITDLTERLEEINAVAATTASELEVASAHGAETERRLSAAIDERGAASARVQQLEALLAETVEERETTRAQLADLERLINAREADGAFATLHIAELTEHLAELEATVAAKAEERDSAAAHSAEVERRLSATVEEHHAASARVQQLEMLLSTTIEERERADARLADLERLASDREADGSRATRRVIELTDRLDELETTVATAIDERDAAFTRVQELEMLVATTSDEREVASTRLADVEQVANDREEAARQAAFQVADLTERLADLEATVATASAQREAAHARVAELEQAMASAVENNSSDETSAVIDKLRVKLTRAEHDAAGAATHIAELSRSAADTQAERAQIEEARAADRDRADAQLSRLGQRINELEELIPVAPPAEVEISTRSLALEELGQLAAQESAHESAETDDEPVEPGELRRSLLASLSDLAHEPVQRADP